MYSLQCLAQLYIYPCTHSYDFHLDQVVERFLPQSRFSPVSQSVPHQRHHSADLHTQRLDWPVPEHYMNGITQCTLLYVRSLSLNILFREIHSTRINFCPETVDADVFWFIQIPFASLCTITNHSSRIAEHSTFPK